MVIVPARNEEGSLAATLDALAGQLDLHGKPLDPTSFEVLLLLNNCTDSSAQVARAWQAAHRNTLLHVAEKTLPPELAHVGTARRLLMDTAWLRLQRRPGEFALHCGILSTDSDTVVAHDWVAQTMRALQHGADAVGGVIGLKPGELENLPEGVRNAYQADREFQRLFAELEDLLDPQAGDPWPRHMELFGASLACTPEAYERAGGLPAVDLLEDMAFADRLYRIDARIRHEPGVRVFTSARFEGRASIGLSWQLRTWLEMQQTGEPHRAPSAPWLQHRSRWLRRFRELHWSGANADLSAFPQSWQQRLREALCEPLTTGEFLARIDCDAWIDQTYPRRTREADIGRVNRDLRAAITRETRKPSNGRRKAAPQRLSGPGMPPLPAVTATPTIPAIPAIPTRAATDPHGTEQIGAP